MKLYAHTIADKDGNATSHLHFASKQEAEFSVWERGKPIAGWQSYVTVVEVPLPWKKALIALSNNPEYLRDLPHRKVQP